MNRNWRWLIAAVAAVAIALSGCATSGGGKLVEDPQGRFTYRASADLKPQVTDGTYDHYTLDSPAMEAYLVAAEAPNEQAGRALAFERIGKDFASLELAGSTSFGAWRADAFSTATKGEWAGIAYQYRGGTLYGMVVYGGGDSTPDTLPAPVAGIIASFEFGKAAGEPFRPRTFAELERFIDSTAASFGGSISVAAVRTGKVVYQYAAGDRGRGVAASPDVAYHWGSITKIVTATAVMQQVEQGRVDLDATLDTYFPEFPLGRRITVRNLLTHSAGLPVFEVDHLVAFGANRMPDHDVRARELLAASERAGVRAGLPFHLQQLELPDPGETGRKGVGGGAHRLRQAAHLRAGGHERDRVHHGGSRRSAGSPCGGDGRAARRDQSALRAKRARNRRLCRVQSGQARSSRAVRHPSGLGRRQEPGRGRGAVRLDVPQRRRDRGQPRAGTIDGAKDADACRNPRTASRSAWDSHGVSDSRGASPSWSTREAPLGSIRSCGSTPGGGSRSRCSET